MTLTIVRKIVTPALLVCLAVACADGIPTSPEGSNSDADDEDVITCLIENGLDPGTYADMKIDGTFNVETILTNSGYASEKRHEGKRKLDGIVNICKLQAGSDICKLARCYQDLRKSPK